MADPKSTMVSSWKVKLSSSLFKFTMKLACRSDGTVNRRLSNFLDRKAPPSDKPISGVKTSDVVVDQSRNLWFRLFTPKNADASCSMSVIVYFHGGGWAFLAANSLPMDDVCRRLAKELNAVIISVNYRLAPDYKYPSQRDDGFDVLSFVDNNPNFEGLPGNADLKNCFIAGDSAGGNIAHHVVVKACDKEFANLQIIGMILIQPGFGGEEKTEAEIRLARGAPVLDMSTVYWLWSAYLPEGSDRDHPAANVFGSNSGDAISRLSKFPATAVIIGGFDPLVDWQKKYYEGLKKAGKEAYLIEFPNEFHGFYCFPELPDTRLFMDQHMKNDSNHLRKVRRKLCK